MVLCVDHLTHLVYNMPHQLMHVLEVITLVFRKELNGLGR